MVSHRNEYAEVDECLLGTDDCDINADCLNTSGGFTCACKTGFQGNGKACTDTNECLEGKHNCRANAQCSNSPAMMDSQAIAERAHLDECILGTDDCDINADYLNTNDGFTCACKTGYQRNGNACTATLIARENQSRVVQAKATLDLPNGRESVGIPV
ncbi:hypothetical protein SARC_07536 [Sphaeroforma arctica JP610]|uniref:EGF-like domain-containing protein n=1 Tax=Sphaeroforma arctica JP610 TaxID=667725 RepID=A0A0L0FVZ6_9EUKA|nr:hypothetical protein SARC_07536 [Sphaeroforma arctica JP610]KNC80093.1 hypothetical protein SARC_07536 [Sphaeroforma arctica JP610]|eukprot:XP_014153995.1 hypothetical protein SARC_07536 [Sphaeroforma arctica JP610]